MPRYIKIPDPVTLLDLTTGEPIVKSVTDKTPEEPWGFARFVARFFFLDPKIGSGRDGGKTISRLNVALSTPKDGFYIIDEADWEKLMKIINSPTDPERLWPPAMVVAQFEDMFQAIEKATK
jgi:hypothetical protein